MMFLHSNHKTPNGINSYFFSELSSDDILDNWENKSANNKLKNSCSYKENSSKYIKPVPTQAKTTTQSHQAPVAQIPEKYRSIFPFPNFNGMQSESFEFIYNTNDNCVVSSPTGSGKTVLFELAIIKLLEAKFKGTDDALLNSKILYMAPTKALCKERYDDWCSKFQPLNCSVGLLTGDSSFVELDSIKKSDLIVCTPEKWDALTRRWTDYCKLLDLVKLLLVDEIHFLREKRGTSLEVVITRMMTLSLNLRIIALSATVPNIKDVSNWLGRAYDDNISNNIHTLVYDDTYRAVALEKTVYGYKTAGTSNPFKFESYLNSKIAAVIRIHSKEKPVLIFCSTRNSTITTAKYLSQDIKTKSLTLDNIPQGISKDLIELSKKGIAYHHAGLSLNERKFVETNFINGKIKILCSTSTLAVGVNLPAYLVIIKGTKVWNNNAMEEYNELDLMQMMGRAGRPQFETKGACVIMTDDLHKDRYMRLVKGTEKLESSLHLNIYENITAEITLKTIHSLESAFNWLQSTFFYQRYLQNPTAYPSIFSKSYSQHSLDVQLKIFLKNVLDELIKENIIENINNEFQCTAYGNAMSKSYVLYETIKKIAKSKEKLTLQESLLLVSESSEFKDLRVKMGDRKLLKDINGNPLILCPVKNNKIEKFSDKVSLLIQFELAGIEFPIYQGSMKLHHEFISEKLLIFKNLPRILKAAIEIFSYKKDSISLSSMLKLNRCICAKSWENSSLVLRQFDGIGLAYAKKLMNRGVTNIAKIKELPRDKLEYYLGMKPGAGQRIAKSITNMPELCLQIKDLKCESNGAVKFTICVKYTNEDNKINYIWNGLFAHINVLTDLSGKILDFRRLPLKRLMGGKSFTLKTNLHYKSDYIRVFFNCDEIAGIGKFVELDVSKALVCLAEKPTENIKSDDSFEFDDDDEVLAAVFGDGNKNTENIKSSNQSTPKLSDISNVSNASSSLIFNVSSSSEPSVTECHHKCSDKSTCRHICCKEGIPKNKVKVCKHACKDKSKCRHMCCREQHEYEQKHPFEKLKKMKQKTLDFSKYTKVNNNNMKNSINILDSPSNISDEVEISSDIDIMENKENISPVSKFKKLNNNQHNIFLRKVSNTSESRKIQILGTPEKEKKINDNYLADLERGKLTTSKFFNSSTKSGKKLLLDLSDSDSNSDSFNTAISKVTKIPKRSFSPDEDHLLEKENSPKRHHCDATNVHTFATKDIESLKLTEMNNSRITGIPKQIESVEEIVIINQTLPQVLPLKLSFIDDGDFHKDIKVNIIEERDFNDEKNDTCSGAESTVMTSIVEENPADKAVFEFLDSDIELD